jgi:hypothetical protein
MPDSFKNELVSLEEEQQEVKAAKKTQKIDNGIAAQKKVFEIKPKTWADILIKGQGKQLFSAKEISILNIAKDIPAKIPTEKQSFVLLEILEKAKSEGMEV